MLTLLMLWCLQSGDVESLLKQLSDDRVERREQATAALLELGEKAEGAIRKFHATATPEAQARCQSILDRLAERRHLARVLPPLELVTMDERDADVRTLLGKLRLPLDLEGVPDKKVTCHFRNVPPLEALDILCRAAGFGWRAPDSRIVVADDNVEISSACHVRHYKVSVARIALCKTQLKGERRGAARIGVSLYWPPNVKPAGDPEIEFKSVVDDQGASLLDPHLECGGFTYIESMNDDLQSRWSTSTWFRHPSKGAKRIASLKGSASIRYSLGRERLIFGDLTEGATKTNRGVTVELETIAVKDGEVRIDCHVGGDLRQLTSVGVGDMMGTSQFTLKDKTGVVYRASTASPTIVVRGPDWERVATTFRCEFKNVMAEPASFEIELDTASHIDTFDFELKDLDLP